MGGAWTQLATNFTPQSIAGLKMWVKADAGITYGSGSSVSGWADQSGNGNSFAQGTASKQPTFVASGINGRPSLQFAAGNSQTMTVSTNFPAPVTVLYVARMTGGTMGRILSGLSNNWLLGWHSNGWDRAYFEGWVYQPSTSSGTTAMIYSVILNGTNSSVWRNGTQLVNASTAGITGPNGLSLVGHNASSEFSDAQISEVILYNVALTTAQRTQVENYLNSRYGAF